MRSFRIHACHLPPRLPGNAAGHRRPCGAVQGQKAEQALTGAVLRVMLARADDDADEAAARDAGGPAGAVVDLLQTAPHSVPYALRVDMFRQLLSMDKVLPLTSQHGPSARRLSLAEAHRSGVATPRHLHGAAHVFKRRTDLTSPGCSSTAPVTKSCSDARRAADGAGGCP